MFPTRSTSSLARLLTRHGEMLLLPHARRIMQHRDTTRRGNSSFLFHFVFRIRSCVFSIRAHISSWSRTRDTTLIRGLNHGWNRAIVTNVDLTIGKVSVRSNIDKCSFFLSTLAGVAVCFFSSLGQLSTFFLGKDLPEGVEATETLESSASWMPILHWSSRILSISLLSTDSQTWQLTSGDAPIVSTSGTLTWLGGWMHPRFLLSSGAVGTWEGKC